MYEVSRAFMEAMTRPAQKRRCYGTIDDVPFTTKDIVVGSMTITNQCSDSTDIMVGQVYTGELKVILRNITGIERKTYKGRTITVYQGLEVSDGVYEDVKLGHFIVSKAVWTVQGVSITAYDNMSKFDKHLTSFPDDGKPYDYVMLACTACSVELGTTQAEFESFHNNRVLEVYPENDMESWRDLIGWIAQAVGCNATINRDGQLVLIPFNQTVKDTFGPKRRLENGEFSDYDSYYTGVSCVNMGNNYVAYYGLEQDTGLTMNLGSNPFLQSPGRKQKRLEVLQAISVINYTPAKVRLHSLMIYDLMDVLEFTGGYVGEEAIKVCITKYTWKLNGDYEIECVGSDPALVSAKSKTDKNISGLMSQVSENEMYWYDFVNSVAYNIANRAKVYIISIDYVTIKTTAIRFMAEVMYDMLEVENEGELGRIRAVYYNGIRGQQEILEYHPIESNPVGTHLLHLYYAFESEANVSGTFRVALETSGCSLRINEASVHALLWGYGLASAADDWDGNIIVDEEIGLVNINITVAETRDNVSLAFYSPIAPEIIDRVNLINPKPTVQTIGDNYNLNNDVMIYSPWVNAEDVTTSASVDTAQGWVGSGSLASGTAQTVITGEVKGVTSVTVAQLGGVYNASPDNGATWWGYSQTQQEWLQNYNMTINELQSITSAQWANFDSVKIRVWIESGDHLYSINFWGADNNMTGYNSYTVSTTEGMKNFDSDYVLVDDDIFALRTAFGYTSNDAIIDGGFLDVIEIDTSVFNSVSSLEVSTD